MTGSWPPAGMSPGMQLPGQAPISWTPSTGNVGYNGAQLMQQLQQLQGVTPGGTSPGGLGAGLGAAAGVGEEAAAGGGLLAKLGQAGFSSPLSGGLKGGLGRAGVGVGLAAAGQVGGAVNQAVGGPQDLTGALKGAGTGAGIGAMFGLPGAAVGGVAGGAIGALSGPVSDLHAVNQYSDLIDKAYLPALKALPKKYHADAREAALSIHNNSAIPLSQKSAALQQLVQAMGTYAKGNKNVFMGGGGAAGGAASGPDLTKRALQVQMEMTNMMNQMGQQGVNQGDAMAQSIRAQIPNVAPQLAPILEQDASARAAYGRQAQQAYTGAANAAPVVAQMQAQLAQLAQLQQQAQSSGSQSFSQLLAGK